MEVNVETRRCKKSGKFTLATLMGFIAVVGLLCLMINIAWQRTTATSTIATETPSKRLPK